MNKKNGFISSTVVYTFFVVVILLMSASLITYSTRTKLASDLKSDSTKPTCSCGGGDYIVNGKLVSAQKYKSSCGTCSMPGKCEKFDGKFYGKEGTEVTENEYTSQCYTNDDQNEQHELCKLAEDNTYYDLDKIKRTSDFSKYCGCFISETNEYWYYNAKVSKEQYNKQCPNQNIIPSNECKKEDNKYYYNGQQISVDDYNTLCLNDKACKKIDNQYYDINGQVVSDIKSQISSCSCQAKNGKYYGLDGEELQSESKYNDICFPTICNSSDTLINCVLKTNYALNNNVNKSTFENLEAKAHNIEWFSKDKLLSPSTEENTIYQIYEKNSYIYFFRGKTDNNWVKYNGLLWRVVNMSETGGTKLILDDPNVRPSSVYTNIDNNILGNDKVRRFFVGLKHSDSKLLDGEYIECYNNKYSNEYNSDILNNLYAFYKNNLKLNEASIKDTTFCADKNIIGDSSDNETVFCEFLYNKNNMFSKLAKKICDKSEGFSFVNTDVDYFTGLETVLTPSKASLDCKSSGSHAKALINKLSICDKEDIYTSLNLYSKNYIYAKMEGKNYGTDGQGILDYSIGLLSIDEALYAGLDLYYTGGQLKNGTNLVNTLTEQGYLTNKNYATNSYLKNGTNFWLSTTAMVDKNITKNGNVYSTIIDGELRNKGIYYFMVNTKGGIRIANSESNLSLRPVIVINEGLTICEQNIKQDGSKNNPFILSGTTDCK